MKTCKTIILMAGVFVALFGLTTKVSGGTPAGGGAASCQVTNPGGGAIALRGTAVVGVLDSLTFGATDVDLTLRLERGANVQYFRHSRNMPVFDKSDGEVVCDFLGDLTGDILTAFGLPLTRGLFITSTSISKTEGLQSIDSPRASSIADITIYAR